MRISGTFYKKLFSADDQSFEIALYKADEKVTTPFGKELSYFKAAGKMLPTASKIHYSFDGSWGKSKTGDAVFNVASYEEMRPNNGAGIMKYLESIDGVGKITARKLYHAFGDDVLNILDNNIDRLREAKIGEGTFRKIKKSWLANHVSKELFAFLYRYNVSQNVAMAIYDRYEDFALPLLQSNPYALMDINGFGFYTADKIARDNEIDMNDERRIRAAIINVLKEYENGGYSINEYNKTNNTHLEAGNTCMQWSLLWRLVNSLLGIDAPASYIGKIALSMEGMELSILDDKYFYRHETFRRERGIAMNIKRLLKASNAQPIISDSEIANQREELRIGAGLPGNLSDEQISAVCMALNNKVSIITGGPGTGKTMIQKAIIYFYEKIKPGVKIMLAAPTGRAAKRMSESTGKPASTIHSLLRIPGEEVSYFGSEKTQDIECDMLIIDEFSMVDTFLANLLFAAIKKGTKIVCVGDDNQLPSVGPGSVLREMLKSNVIPSVKLSKVFRQAKGSAISYNAARINVGNTDMIYDESFMHIEETDSDNISDEVISLYKEYVAKYGIDNVTVLTPFREKTVTGVNFLNKKLKESVLDASIDRTKTFSVGDKVMFTKNYKDLTNGDIGYVVGTEFTADDEEVIVDFGGEEPMLLSKGLLKSLDLAYATTIHKSQGTEYKVVIMVVDPHHKVMLKKNLLYTAVTRAKEKLVIVGSMKAFKNGIVKEETSKRESELAHFLKHDETTKSKKQIKNNEVQISFF